MFFEQFVIHDTKSNRGILLTRRGSYLVKLRALLAPVFTPDAVEPVNASLPLEIVFESILNRRLPYTDWTRPFDTLDDKKREGESTKHPEREAEQDALDAALQELIPYINAHREPDWKAFAKEHTLGSETIDSLRFLYQKYTSGS